jgi:hypothetical protein
VWSRLSQNRRGLPVPSNVPHILITKRRPTAAHDRKVAELRRRVALGKAGYRIFATEIPETEGVPEALERVTSQPNYARKWNAQIRSHLVDLAGELESALVAMT